MYNGYEILFEVIIFDARHYFGGYSLIIAGWADICFFCKVPHSVIKLIKGFTIFLNSLLKGNSVECNILLSTKICLNLIQDLFNAQLAVIINIYILYAFAFLQLCRNEIQLVEPLEENTLAFSTCCSRSIFVSMSEIYCMCWIHLVVADKLAHEVSSQYCSTDFPGY